MTLRRILTSIGLVAILVVATTVWLRAAPSIGAVAATPSYIVVNTATPVLFTVRIDDSSVIATGVNLLKTDAAGKTLSIVGVMRDNGAAGDAVAGDKTFSLQLSPNEVAPGSTFYRVSAAFRGVLKRELSALIEVGIWKAFTDSATGVALGYPPNWDLSSRAPLRPSALSDVSFYSADEAVQVTIYSNPSSLAPSDWYNTTLRGKEYTGALGSDYDFVDSIELVTVKGKPGLRVVGALFFQRAERVFVQVDGHIVGIEYVQPSDWPSSDVLSKVLATLSN